MATRETLEADVGRALTFIARWNEEAQERAAQHEGMHPTDFRCLAFLSVRSSPASPRDIIAHLGLTSGAGTALLDRLEAAGYVRRVPHPEDRRSVLIVLDPVAAAKPLALHERIATAYVEATAELSDSELAAVARFLVRIEAISAEVNEGLNLRSAPEPAADGPKSADSK